MPFTLSFVTARIQASHWLLPTPTSRRDALAIRRKRIIAKIEVASASGHRVLLRQQRPTCLLASLLRPRVPSRGGPHHRIVLAYVRGRAIPSSYTFALYRTPGRAGSQHRCAVEDEALGLRTIRRAAVDCWTIGSLKAEQMDARRQTRSHIRRAPAHASRGGHTPRALGFRLQVLILITITVLYPLEGVALFRSYMRARIGGMVDCRRSGSMDASS